MYTIAEYPLKTKGYFQTIKYTENNINNSLSDKSNRKLLNRRKNVKMCFAKPVEI